jgi:hypothetical protein
MKYFRPPNTITEKELKDASERLVSIIIGICDLTE